MISEFINYMRENLSPQDNKAIVDWLQVSAELSEDNETLIKAELPLVIDSLNFVKNNFKPEVFQQSLRFPTICDEIIHGALCFNAGYTKEEVTEFANKGYLESGHIPGYDGEKGIFTVIQVTEPECSVTVSDNVSDRLLQRWIMRASINKPNEDIADILESYTERYSAQIKRVLNEPLQKAFVKAIENSTMVKSLIKFNPGTGEIECIPNSNLEKESIENKYSADLIATYEEQMDIPFGDKVTDYFGDYGIHHFRHGVSEERVKEIYQRALDAIGMTEDEFKADGSMKYRSNIADRMSEHLSGTGTEVDETTEASIAPKMSL